MLFYNLTSQTTDSDLHLLQNQTNLYKHFYSTNSSIYLLEIYLLNTTNWPKHYHRFQIISIMGNMGIIKVNSKQNCCTASICTPQPELELSQYKFDSHSRAKAHPSHYSEFQDQFVISSKQSHLDSSYLQKLQQASNFGKCLQLQVICAATLPKGSLLNFNPIGLQNSLRGARDGHTYFGCKKRVNETVFNDFLIPDKDSSQQGRHFVIFYDLDQDAYFIRDLAKGFGIFLKIVTPTILQDNFLLQMGDNFILVNLCVSNTSELSKLRLKLFGPPGSGQMFYFNPRQHTDSFISIGRYSKCDIQINNSLTSKIQASISFDQQSGWIVEDGDKQTGRPSTNGTWLYLNQKREIFTGMIFKSNHTLFQANVV